MDSFQLYADGVQYIYTVLQTFLFRVPRTYSSTSHSFLARVSRTHLSQLTLFHQSCAKRGRKSEVILQVIFFLAHRLLRTSPVESQGAQIEGNFWSVFRRLFILCEIAPQFDRLIYLAIDLEERDFCLLTTARTTGPTYYP